MSIAITIDLPVDPKRCDEFLELIKSVAPDTRAYDGCERFDIYTDQDRPGRVFFYEIWESRPKQEKYLQWRTETGLVEKMGKYLTGAPTFSYFDKLDG
jgi:quinol monooxygenase YgiN